MSSGWARTGRVRTAVRPAASRSRKPRTARSRPARARATPARSSTTSGTIRLPASVGVEARRSATQSSSGWSFSCPMALTTGVRAAATARIRDSSLKARRSSKEPPPRAITMTSTSAMASSSRSAWVTARTAPEPWTATSRTSKSTAGQRRDALRMTSFSASELRPVTRPTRRGSRGRGFFRAASKSPSSARARRSRSSRSSRSPRPTGRMPRPSMDSRPVLAQKSGLS